MEIQIIHNRDIIWNYLKNNSEQHFYTIGDLDDFFWPKTIWYGLMDKNDIKSIALLYVGTGLPTFLLFCEENSIYAKQLIAMVKPIVPKSFYVHLSPGLMDLFGKQNLIEYLGLHLKMVLKKKIFSVDMQFIRRLTRKDLTKLEEFYNVAYPQNWFDSRMLETNKYFGYFVNEKLVGISGIHVYSTKYNIAALGNIATLPDYRKQGIGYKVISALCFDLQKDIKCIGLNVHADNKDAIHCYQRIGFEITGQFDEGLLKAD